MKICINGMIREMSADELAVMQEETEFAAASGKHRPMTESEVSRLLITAQINSLDVDDQTALRMLEFYPVWTAGAIYEVGYKVQYHGRLYKVIMAHTAQSDWTPDTAVTLFQHIDEEHNGTRYDPIPYTGNMELKSGLYYTEDGVRYLCTRETGAPVYHRLSDLTGIYVEVR